MTAATTFNRLVQEARSRLLGASTVEEIDEAERLFRGIVMDALRAAEEAVIAAPDADLAGLFEARGWLAVALQQGQLLVRDRRAELARQAELRRQQEAAQAAALKLTEARAQAEAAEAERQRVQREAELAAGKAVDEELERRRERDREEAAKGVSFDLNNIRSEALPWAALLQQQALIAHQDKE